MKALKISIFASLLLSSCSQRDNSTQSKSKVKEQINTNPSEKGYSEVNGIKMYYEIYGKGDPLVLIHGGGSTIESNWGRVIALFAETRKVVAVELQAHGRTADRGKASTFEQDADDVATLLTNLNIPKADIFGFSNGATTGLQIAIRHPQIVDKLVLGSPLYKRDGVPAGFWDFMNKASLDNMPPELKEAYLAVSQSPEGLKIMHDRDAARMVDFKDIPDVQIKSIQAKSLIIIGDKDVISPEHAIGLSKLIAGAHLAIIPGTHGEYIGEITTLKSNTRQADFVVPMIERFLAL